METTAFIATLPAPLTRRGPNYASDVTLAKTIRTELALAVKAGVLPDGTKCSVRIRHHSALDVDIVEWHGGAVFCDEYTVSVLDPSASFNPRPEPGRRMADARFSPTLQRALLAIETIAERHNYDNSRSEVDHFDVGYYMTVGAGPVAALAMRSLKIESDPVFADLVARATEAAKQVGPKVVKSVCGRDGLEGCGDYSLNRLIKVADKAQGRDLTYDKSRGWVAKAAA